MSRTKKIFLAVGAALLIGLLVVVICGSSGWRNWDFDTWFNYWGQGRSEHSHMEVTDYGKSPTCTENGLTDGKHCFICKAVIAEQQIIPATGHAEVTDNGESPTCTENGLTDGKHCSTCNTVLVEQQEIPATGHAEVTDNGIAATCTDSGLTDGKHCSTCGTITVEQQVTPIIPHDYIYGVCSVCGQENPNPVFDSNAFYLVGSMNGWVWTSDKYKFIAFDSDNPNIISQYKLTITLTAGTEFKVWKGAWNGNGSYLDSFESVDYIVWTDNGLGGSNPACTETATYNFYLKFYSDGGCSIYCEKL